MSVIDFTLGPKPDVSYPIKVLYCGNCSMPIEVSWIVLISLCIFNTQYTYIQYCEYYPEYEKCKQWLERNLPTEFEKVKVDDDTNEGGAEEEKKRQKRGGKGMMKVKKKEDGPKQVCVSRAPRGKKKSVTVVTGLSTFGNTHIYVQSTWGIHCMCFFQILISR